MRYITTHKGMIIWEYLGDYRVRADWGTVAFAPTLVAAIEWIDHHVNV
jgi:hypothetical protein